MSKFIIYTDGGARGNPGPAALGVVVKRYEARNKRRKTISKYAKFIGRATNNQAEYKALIFGLEKVKTLGAQEVDCFLDSELAVKQLNLEYKVKDKDLGPLFIKVWNLQQDFKKINFYHISRDKNKEADRLVNRELDHWGK